MKTLNPIENLHFFGPFTFTKGNHSLFESEYSEKEGIYIWTIKDEKNNLNLIHYIGETSSFAKRHREHLLSITGLNYRIIDANHARQGVETILWNGLWRDKTSNGVATLLEVYPTLAEKVIAYIYLVKVYIAPTNFPNDIRRHIEGSIASNLRYRYPNFTTFYPRDNKTVSKKEKLEQIIQITSDEIITGLDATLKL